MYIEIERRAPDGLTRQRWEFRINAGFRELTMHLASWISEQRPTTRHQKWKSAMEGWRRRPREDYTTVGFRRPAAEVPLPDDVIEEAKANLMARLAVIGPVDPPEKKQ